MTNSTNQSSRYSYTTSKCSNSIALLIFVVIIILFFTLAL